MARTFNGSTQYLAVASTPITSPPCTIACWGKTSDTTNSQYAVVIINSAAPTSQGNLGLNFAGATSGDPIRAVAQGSGGPGISAAGTYSSGVWTHAAAVFASTSSRTAYHNGTAGTADTTSVTPSGINTVEIARLGSIGAHFSGDLADVGIWNVALTDSEIAALAAGVSCRAVRPDALVAYFPLLTGDSNVDWWGQYNMTATGSPTDSQHAPVIYPSGIQTFIPAAGGGGSTAAPIFRRRTRRFAQSF